MDSNIISLIIGGSIGIVSGITVQVVSSILSRKSEKQKFVFSKLEEIINGISRIEDGLQYELAQLYGVFDPNKKPDINLSFERKKLECTIKIYHPKLTHSLENVFKEMDVYYSAKRFLVRKQRNKEEVQTADVEKVGDAFDGCNHAIDKFIEDLSEYGAKIVK